MNDETNTNRGLPRHAARLRLVASRPLEHVALPPGSYDVRFTSTRRPDASRNRPGSGHERGRTQGRPKKGTIMRIIERVIETVGRFVVGLCIGLALVCAFVIVTTDPRLDVPATAAAVEVIRLDPVVVTISADRYDELQAASRAPSAIVRIAEHGAAGG